MATVIDNRGKLHNALNFVLCVDEGNTQLLTQGKVYANLGKVPATADNIYVIDDRGLKQNFSKARFEPFISEKGQWAKAKCDYVNIKFGKLYRISKTRDGAGPAAQPGNIYVIDETGSWMVYAISAFAEILPLFSAQYLAAKLKSAYPKDKMLEPGTYEGRVTNVTENLQINFVVDKKVDDKVNDIRYVQVRFEPEGKLYTYKHRGEVKAGDEAVVRVENKLYHELCGTKVVEVINVLDSNPTHYDLKWLVSVVNLDDYRARQAAEAALKEAETLLTNRINAMAREEVLKLLLERDPVTAELYKKVKQLKTVL